MEEEATEGAVMSEAEQKTSEDMRSVAVSAHIMSVNHPPVDDQEDADWFKLYWQRKRDDYYLEGAGVEEIRRAAIQLDQDIANFWRFKAKNTLRLM